MGAFLFAKYLHARGESVVFAALDGTPDGLIEEVAASGIPTHVFDLGGWLGMRKRGIVQSFVESHGIDVVMSDGLRPDIVGAGLRDVVRVSNVRGLLREHYALDYPWGVAQVATWAQSMALKKLDGVFAISPEILAHLTGLGVASVRLHVVDNFIDVDAVIEAGQGETDLGVGIHVGLFGALIRRKRIDVALRGFAGLLRARGSLDATLHIVGDGPLRSELGKLASELEIADQVIFHGFVAHPLPLMAQMDVVLLTSDREGVPRALMEALALGRTCVSSAFPGIDSIIQDGETGYVFNPGDHDGLAALLERVIGEAVIPEQRLLDYMKSRHDVEVCGAEMWREIQQIVQAR
jgi:glycosyltransferase involved in cell wall biosynthesis